MTKQQTILLKRGSCATLYVSGVLHVLDNFNESVRMAFTEIDIAPLTQHPFKYLTTNEGPTSADLTPEAYRVRPM